MATKKRSIPLASQQIDWSTLALDPAAKPEAPAAEEAPQAGMMRRYVGDTAASLGRGVVQGVRMLSDTAGADNAVSTGLRSVEDFIGSLQSASAKADQQEMARILKEAEGKGVLDQVVAGVKAFGVAPLQTMAQAAGASLPTIGAALIPGVGPAAVATRFAAPLALGAAQGAGGVKSSIYDEVKQRALQEGRTPAEAEQLAVQAQEYSSANGGQIALGAGLGAWAGKSGLEGAAQRLVYGTGGKAAGGMAARVATGAVAEGIPEALQGGQEKYAGNVAQTSAGFPTDPMSGVVANATMEGLAGHVMGGAMGIPNPGAAAQVVDPAAAIRATKQPEGGPMTRAANAAIEAQAQAAEAGLPNLPTMTAEQEAAALTAIEQQGGKDAKGLRQFAATASRAAGTRPASGAPVGQQPGADTAEPSATVSDMPFADRVLTLQEQLGDQATRQALRDEFGDEALSQATYYASIADRPDVQLPNRTRDNMLALAERMVQMALLKPVNRPGLGGTGPAPDQLDGPSGEAPPQLGLDTGLTGVMRADSAGNVAPETNADAINTRNATPAATGDDRQARKASAVNADPAPPAAPGMPALGYDTTPTGRMRAGPGGVAPETNAQAINTRQAQAERDAEAQRKADLGLTPDVQVVQERNALPKQLATDIKNPKGQPFTHKRAAETAQKKAKGGTVLQVAGGWVVRPDADNGAAAAPFPETQEPANVQAAAVPAPAAPPAQQEGADSAGAGTAEAAATGAAGSAGAAAAAVEAPGLKQRYFSSVGMTMTMPEAAAKVKELEAEQRAQKKAAASAPTKILERTADEAASRAATLARKLREDIRQIAKSFPDAQVDLGQSQATTETAINRRNRLKAERSTANAAAPEVQPPAQADDTIDPFTLDKRTLNQRIDRLVAAGEASDLISGFMELRKRYMKATGKPSIPPAGSRAVPIYPEGSANLVAPAPERAATAASGVQSQPPQAQAGTPAEGGGGARPTPAVAPATHKDPGEPAEPVTPAVVREAIKTGVQATDRKPSAMKAELLAKIDEAIASAPEEALPVWKQPTKDQIRTAMVGMKLTSMDRAEQALRTAHENRVAEASRRIGHVSFSVEGDGRFTVLNSKPYLQEFRRKVAASPGFKTQRPGPIEAPRDGGDNGSGSKVAAFDNMVNEGDLEAASDYADAVGLELDPKKIANATKVLKWREERGAAPAPVAEPAPAPAPQLVAETAQQDAAILDAAAEPPKGAERLSVIKDVKAGAITPEEVAAAYPAATTGTESLNKRHAIAKKQVLTPGGALKADATNSTADSAVWYYQGDMDALRFTASVTVNGEADPRADDAKRMLVQIKAAQDAGWRRANYRAGSLGTVWVFQRGDEFLTRAGMENAAAVEVQRPVLPDDGPGYDKMVARQRVLARAFNDWLLTLPEEQQYNRGVVSRKIGETPVGQWAGIGDDPKFGLTLRYFPGPGEKEAREVGWTIQTQSRPDWPALRDYIAELAAEAPVDGANAAPATAPATPAAPATALDAFKATMQAVYDGTATVEDYQAGYARVRDETAMKAELGKMTKDDLTRMFGIMRDGKKDELVAMAYSSMLRNFAMGKEYGPSGGYMMTRNGMADYEAKRLDALDELVAGQTADDLAAFAAEQKRISDERAGNRAALVEAVKDPKTLDDFRNHERLKLSEGMSAEQARMSLTPEQRALRDELAAEFTRGKRKERTDEQRTTVRAAGQTTAGEIIATKHTRDGHDLWVVKLSDRVSKDDYVTLLAGAKRLGGNYSSFRGNGAVPGFQFRTPDAAQAFLKLAGGDTAAAAEVAQERRNAFEDDRSQSASERLTEMADRLEERADESMGRDRKANTDRRARFAASAEASARADKAMATTMRNIAGAIGQGGAKFLDRARQKVQVELLQTYVANGRDALLRAKYPTYAEQERHKGEAPTIEAADYAEFPTFTAYRSDLASLGRQLLEVDGTKKLGERIMKVADDVSDAFTAFAKEPGNLFRLSTFSVRAGDEMRTAIFPTREGAERAITRSGLSGKAIVFPEKRGVNRIIMSPSEAMARGIWKGDGDKRITLTDEFGNELVEKIGRVARRGAKVSAPWQFERTYDRRKQLGRMGIETPAEFRAALREFIAMREQPAEADKIKAMERAMIGRRNDGLDFFPTPESVADEMVAAAGIQPGMRVLEPSAGMGHIAERIRAAEVEPDVAEFSANRRELLEAKGFNVVAQDFMALEEGDYDRILMNPPFSDGRDIQHVRHAYDVLKPGGRLVAIMGESAFFNQSKRATEFREWLDSVGGTSEKLPEGTFNDPSLPVNTGANARMVVVDKPGAEQAPDGSQPDTTMFSRADGQQQPASARRQAVEALVQQIAARWENAPEVVVIDSMSDPRVPEAVRKEDSRQQSQGAAGAPEGFFFGGKVYLIAPQLAGDADVVRVLFHESLGHFGLRGTFGPALAGILDRVAILQAAKVRTKAKQYGLDYDKPSDRRAAAEEVLAEMAQNTPTLGWGQKAIAAVRTWLRTHVPGFRKMALSDAEIVRSYIMPARAFVQRGGPAGGPGGGVRFSRSTGPGFAAWFKGSKVVDDQGRPLVVYHGTNKDITAFKPGRGGGAMWFAADPKLANLFVAGGRRDMGQGIKKGSAIYPAHLSVQNPLDLGRTSPQDSLSVADVLKMAGLPADQQALRAIADANLKSGYAFVSPSYPDPAGYLVDQYQRAGMRAANTLDDPGLLAELQKAGFDGLKMIEEGAATYAVFRPEQIKSATGNGGNFDAESADIRFSRASIADAVRDFSQAGARNAFLDAVTTHGGTNLWSRTVGTQYHKAKANPTTFGRVFDAVQDYIKDTSVFANKAADNAPSLLPKLDSWLDLKKGGLRYHGAKPADTAKAGEAIFRGTLDKVLYDDETLASRFGLNELQRGLYREFRLAVNESLDGMTKSEMLRLAGDDGRAVRAEVLAAPDAETAAEVLTAHLTELAELTANDDLLGTVARIGGKVKRMQQLQDEGYAPLMRFGKHTLHVQREDGSTEFFGMYESVREANIAARAMRGDEALAGMTFTQGVMSEQGHKLFNGMSLDALELFADATDNAQNPVYQEYLKLALSNRSAMKRMIERKAIKGYSDDVARVLASFVTSNARMSAGNLHLTDAKKMAEAIPKEVGDLRDDAINLVEYVTNPVEEAAAARALLFTSFIGGSVASALVNMTQPITMTLPYLTQWGGVAKAGKRLVAAMAMVASGKGMDADLAAALARAEQDGIVSPQEIHHLQAEAMNTLGKHPFLKKAAFVWGAMFSLAEQFNRRVSFVAAYQTAQAEGIANPFEFAELAVVETQGLYNKGNKANWARGAIGATAMTFKQFSTHYLEWLVRMAKSGPEGRKAVAVALALLLLTAGAGGLPFADDLDDLIDTLGQAMGHDTNSKRWKRQFVAQTLGLGDVAAEVATRGLSALPGIPMDLSLRMGMGNLLPATGLFLRSNTDTGRQLLEVAGAAGGLAANVMDGVKKAAGGDVGGGLMMAMPVAVQNMAKAAQMWDTGEFRNRKGALVMEADGVDAAMKFISFQPAAVARESNRVNEILRTVQLAKNVEAEIAGRWAQGMADNDQEAIKAARQELADWNKANPTAPIRITMPQVLQRLRALRATRAERTLKQTPKELRPLVAETFK